MKTPKETNSNDTKRLAESDAKAKILVICFVGFTVMFLAIAGAVSFFVAPSHSKDVWGSVSPILSGAISGLLGFWAGAAQRKT
jgi:membrane associated rhomboid family serine protease